jgi:hypothetical protein
MRAGQDDHLAHLIKSLAKTLSFGAQQIEGNCLAGGIC